MKNKDFKGKHFITLQDWSRQEIDHTLALAGKLKKKYYKWTPHRMLRDKTLFMMFFEQSTRTRNSMEAGMTQLGGHAHDLTPDKMQLSHGESARDTAMVLSRMGHGIACRNCFYGIGNKYLNELADNSRIPVMSLQDDLYHPMQGLADLMTIQEYFGKELQLITINEDLTVTGVVFVDEIDSLSETSVLQVNSDMLFRDDLTISNNVTLYTANNTFINPVQKSNSIIKKNSDVAIKVSNRIYEIR